MSQGNFIINGRTVVHRKSGGYAEAISINLTGAEKKPLPYSLRADADDLDNLAHGLMVNDEPCATIESFVRCCKGDEAGDGGGIFSGTIGGRCDFLTASPDTLVSDDSFMVNGKPLVREGDLMLLNHRNSALTQWCQSSGSDAQKIDGGASENEAVTTPYQISIAILGQDADSSSQYIALSEAEHVKPVKMLPVDEPGNNIDSSQWRRLQFKNLEKDKRYSLEFRLFSEEDEPIVLPLSIEAQASMEAEESGGGISAESHLFLPVKLGHSLWQEEDKFNPQAGHYSDILFFDEELRQKIYSELLHYQLRDDERIQNSKSNEAADFFKAQKSAVCKEHSDLPSLKTLDKSWYTLLSDSLRHQVDEQKIKHSDSYHLREGYVYIFLEGFLWREIRINPHGQLQEINLRKEAGKPVRHAKGRPCHRLYLPCLLGGRSVKIEMAFSDIQWSWARIQYFGGVNPDDIRFKAHPELWSEAEDADKRRRARFVELDLSTYRQDNPEQENREKQRLLHHYQQEEMLVKLYLEDALLPLTRALADIDFLSAMLHQSIKLIHQAPYFLTGLTCYRYFFDQKSAYREPYSVDELQNQRIKETYEMMGSGYEFAGLNPVQRQLALERFNKMAKVRYPSEDWEQGSFNDKLEKFKKKHFNDPEHSEYARMQQQGKANILLEHQKYLDRQKLEALLKVVLRSRIRQMIDIIQELVVQLVCPDNDKRKELPLAANSDFNPYEVFRDYFSQAYFRYEQAWSMLSSILTRLSLDPEQIDNELDIHQSASAKKAGQEFINSILIESHPLYPMIFADEKHIQQAQNFNPDKPNEYFNDLKKEDNGDFNGLKFAAAWSAMDMPSFMQMLDKGLNAFHQVITDVSLSVLNSHVELSDEEFEQAKQFNFQLLKASGQPVLSLVSPEKELNLQDRSQELIGYNETHSPAPGNVHPFQSKTKMDSTAKAIKPQIKLMENGNALVSFSSQDQTLGFNARTARASLNDHLWQTGQAKVNETGYGFILKETSYVIKDIEQMPQSQNSILRQKQREGFYRYERVMDQKQGVFKKNALLIDRSTTSILAIFSFMNLVTVQREVLVKKKNEASEADRNNISVVYINFFFSIESVIKTIIPMEKLYKFYSLSISDGSLFKNNIKISFVPIISLLGLSASGFSLLSTLHKSHQLLDRHDTTGAIINALNSVTDIAGMLIFQGGRVADKLALRARELVKSTEIAYEEAMTIVTEEFMVEQGAKVAIDRFLFCFASSFLVMGVVIVLDLFIRAMYGYFRDKPLTQWVKTSPFSIYQNEKPKNDFDYIAELMEIILSPKHQINHIQQSKSNDIALEISFPWFDIGKHHLDLRTSVSNNHYIYIDIAFPAGRYVKEKKIPELNPAKIREIHYFIKPGGLLQKVKIVFDGTGLFRRQLEYESYENHLQCRYRLFLENNVALPLQRRNQHILPASEYKKSDDKEGWYRTEEIVFLGN